MISKYKKFEILIDNNRTIYDLNQISEDEIYYPFIISLFITLFDLNCDNKICDYLKSFNNFNEDFLFDKLKEHPK